MTDNHDQLAELGQQVIDALVATYNPNADPQLALALFPGQALADGIVQNGVANELRISNWLADQYDYPLALKLADATPIPTSTLNDVTAKSAYVAMARWCAPGVPADSPSFPRIADLIAQARRDLGGNPEALPFSCEPTDFAEDGCPGWQVFDTVITAHSDQTTTPPGGPRPPILVNPELWRLRALSADVIDELPARRLAATMSQLASNQLLTLVPEEASPAGPPSLSAAIASSRLSLVTQPAAELAAPPAAAEVVAQPADTAAVAAASPSVLQAEIAPGAFRTESQTGTSRLILDRVGVSNLLEWQLDGDVPVWNPPEPTPVQHEYVLDTDLAEQLVHVNVDDLAGQPSVSTATTSDSALHVHFEHLLITITRRIAGTPWWHPELLAEPAWYVPGMARGALVPSSDDPSFAHCLPLSLLLVRNVSLTGQWSDEARAAMSNSVHYFGPFLMSGGSSTSDSQSTDQTSTYGLGIQVIGALAGPLPALPPMGDPAATG